MTFTDKATLRVLVPLTAVLLVGVITAVVQQGDDASGETVVPGSASPTPTVRVTPTTTRRPVVSATPTRPVVVPTTTSTAPVVPTTAPPVVVTPTTAPPTTPTATPSPTPTPTPPFLPGPATSGMTALDGVRLEVRVDRSQAEVGDEVAVTTVVTNTRPTAIVYRATCPSKVTVRSATGANGQPSVSWAGDRQTFKDLALTGLVNAGNAFTPQADSKGPVCTPGDLVDLAAGATITERFSWTATTAYNSAYDGQAPVTASFSFALDRTLDPTGPEFSTVESSAPLRLVGQGSSVVPPTVAVDAALAISAFGRFVEEGDSAVWEPPYAAGSKVGASVSFVPGGRGSYFVVLQRPDGRAFVRVAADTGIPNLIDVK